MPAVVSSLLGRLAMLENLIAVAMFVILGIAVFTIGGLDQSA